MREKNLKNTGPMQQAQRPVHRRLPASGLQSKLQQRGPHRRTQLSGSYSCTIPASCLLHPGAPRHCLVSQAAAIVARGAPFCVYRGGRSAPRRRARPYVSPGLSAPRRAPRCTPGSGRAVLLRNVQRICPAVPLQRLGAARTASL